MIKTGVFQRTQVDGAILSPARYNLMIGAVLSWGFWLNWVIVKNVNPVTLSQINPFIFFTGYFVSCILGIYLFNKSTKPLVSFIGYNLIVVPFGFILNLILARHAPGLILQAVQVTALVTIITMASAMLFPGLFLSMGGLLFFALLAVIVVEMFQVFFLKMHSSWIDWVIALIFCGYIGYDWARANKIPKTLDNAIDSAAAIYIDIINLFIRIVSILAGSKEK
jgi:FtsH-binding integral membrane protein